MPSASFPHIPQVRLDYECPLPSVYLPLANRRGEYRVRFVLDTGAAITLIPKTVADRWEIEYDKAPAAERLCPRTLAGRMTGCHRGEIRTTFLTRPLVIPCFVYAPPPSQTKAAVKGPPGAKRRERRISDPAAYFQELEENEEGGSLCVLGRVGFMNRFHVMIDGRQTTVSTESLTPPEPLPSGCLSLPWFWK